MQFIQTNLELLETLRAKTEAAFLGDPINIYAAEHAPQVSIEAVMDIFTHIVARGRLGAPVNDRDTLEIVYRKGLIPEDHFRRYTEMSKFRNLIVHGYLDVNTRAVYEIVQNRLDDLRVFLSDVRRIVNTRDPGMTP